MNFLSTLFTIAVPIILQNFLSSFVNMLDTIMVGQLGSVDIAAVGLGNQIFFIMNITMFGIVSGGSIFMTQFWGKKDLNGVHRTMGITITASAVISVLFFCAATFAPEFCLRIYSKDNVVIEHGAAYLRAVAPSYIFTGLGFSISHALRSTERVKLPMVSTAISVIVNGIFNYILIFGIRTGSVELIPAMGVIGAAFATTIARIVEFMILLIVPYKKGYEIAVPPRRYFSKHEVGFIPRYIKICVPVLLSEAMWAIGISLQSSIYAHAGTKIIAAFNITSTISNLVWTFFIGCGNAAAIILGKKIGEEKIDEARHLSKRLTGFMAGAAAVLGLLLIPLAFMLKYFFKVEPEVIRMAQVFLFITVILYPIYATNMNIIVGVCRSGGDTMYGLFLDNGFMWLLALPLGFCAINFWHLPFWGIFLCIHTEDICKCVMGLLRLHSGKWLHDLTS